MNEQIPQEQEPTPRSLIEKTHDKLATQLDDLRHDPDMQDLVRSVALDTEYNEEITAETFDDEAQFMETIEEVFNFRKGESRLEQTAKHQESGKPQITLSEATKAAAEKMINKSNMRKTTHPSQSQSDVVFVAGGAGLTPARRLEHVADVETGALVMIGSERPVSEAELGRAGKYGYSYSTYNAAEEDRKPAATEFELTLNTAAHRYEIADDEWVYEREGFEGDDPRIPENFASRYRIAYATKDDRLIAVVSAPMIDEERTYPDGNVRTNANSPDGFKISAELLDSYFEELAERTGNTSRTSLVSTDSVFVPFQGADAESILAPYGIESETVGISREDAGLPDWPLGTQFYIQEILSTARSLRNGRDRLEEKDEEGNRHVIQLSQ